MKWFLPEKLIASGILRTTQSPWFSYILQAPFFLLIVFTPLLFSERFGLIRSKIDLPPINREDLVYFLGLLLLWIAACRCLRLLPLKGFGNPALDGSGNLSRKGSFLFPFLLIFGVIWLAYSAWHSPVSHNGWISFRFFLAYLGVFWYAWQEASPAFARKTAVALLIPGWINSLMGILQYLGRDPLFETPQGNEVEQGRLYLIGFSGNPNFLAPFLLICLVTCGALLLTSRNLYFRVFLLISAVIFSVTLLLTQTFTVFLAMAVCLLVFPFFIYHHHRIRLIKAVGMAALMVLGLVLSIQALSSFGFLRNEFTVRLLDIYEAFSQQRWDRLLHGRYYAFSLAWEMILDHPWKGLGLASFPHHSFSYEIALPQLDYFEFFMRSYRFHGEAHNDYLQLWAECGFPALIGALLFLAAILVRAFQKMAAALADTYRLAAPPPTSTGLTRQWLICCMIIVVSLAINALASFPLHLTHLALMLAVSLGFSLGFILDSEDRQETLSPGRPMGKGLFMVLAALLGLSIGMLAFIQIPNVQARILRDRMEPYFVLIGRQMVKGGDETRNVSVSNIAYQWMPTAQRAVELEPENADNQLALGLMQRFLFQWQPAKESLQRAARLKPTADTYFHLAWIDFRNQSIGEMRESFAMVLRFNPFHSQTQDLLRVSGAAILQKPYPPSMIWHPAPLAEVRTIP